MRAVDIIIKKREKQELTQEEIHFFVKGFTSGEIPDYQASAWAMAIYFNGMTMRETSDLTLSMAFSGQALDLLDVVPFAVDKHSTGGVGDKTSLVVLPIVAACGLPVGKMSGRGLGFTGGTLDKLESIPGYRVDLSTAEFKKQLKKIGIVLTGQSLDLAPADGKLYALRDVTGTVPSIPLIASSIMSKKIAAGAQAILLDVKTGNGAFMDTLAEARELASTMVSIGEMTDRKVLPLLSDMNQPLGHAVGNALEVREGIETLHGGGPEDFREHCLAVAAHLLMLGSKAHDLDTARLMAEDVVANEQAFRKFRELVIAQGGDVRFVDEPDRLPKAEIIRLVKAPQSGWLAQILARSVGESALALGAGREKKGDPVNHAVGLVIHHKVGDRLERGQPLFTVHASNAASRDEVVERVLSAHIWSQEPVKPLPLFYN